MTDAEFERILADTTKTIEGDIRWWLDVAHPPTVRFRVTVHSQIGTPLVIEGRYHPDDKKLNFTMVHGDVGRIYGLDMGKKAQESFRQNRRKNS